MLQVGLRLACRLSTSSEKQALHTKWSSGMQCTPCEDGKGSMQMEQSLRESDSRTELNLATTALADGLPPKNWPHDESGE